MLTSDDLFQVGYPAAAKADAQFTERGLDGNREGYVSRAAEHAMRGERRRLGGGRQELPLLTEEMDSAQSAHDAAEHNETLRSLEQLPERQRQVAEGLLAGKQQTEIAAELGFSHGQVWRLVKNLRTNLGPKGPLTERELEVLRLTADGLTREETARTLFVSLETVKTHRKSAIRKTGARNITHAVAKLLTGQL